MLPRNDHSMASSSIPAGAAFFGSSANTPLLLVLALSIVIGLLMVNVFRYASNQKAIGRAKDRLKAHLLAVRLFQDQLPVVMRAYARILRGTGSYLRLAFTPFLIAILPITFMIVQLDRYFGWVPLQPAQTFLVEARLADSERIQRRFAAIARGTLELGDGGPHSERQGDRVAGCGRARRTLRHSCCRRRADSFEAGRGIAGTGPHFAGALARTFLGAHLCFRRAGAGG